MAGWDHNGRPFAILDKRQAQVLVFSPDGKLLATTPVLLGYAAGDDSVAGIGLRPIAQVRPSTSPQPVITPSAGASLPSIARCEKCIACCNRADASSSSSSRRRARASFARGIISTSTRFFPASAH